MFLVEVNWRGVYHDGTAKYKVIAYSFDEAVKKALAKFHASSTKDFKSISVFVSSISGDVIEIK